MKPLCGHCDKELTQEETDRDLTCPICEECDFTLYGDNDGD